MPEKTIDIKKVEGLFTQYDNQHDILIALYKIVFPDWDDIEQIKGNPTVSSSTWKEICDLFIDFDKKHHPEVLAGGIWLNMGFNTSSDIEDGVVEFSTSSVQKKTFILAPDITLPPETEKSVQQVYKSNAKGGNYEKISSVGRRQKLA